MITPERIARSAFGSADWLKVQSQHERFLREIQNLSEDKKAVELLNAIRYLFQNKSDYWIEAMHLLHVLLGSDEVEGFYKKIEPNMTKKEFCPKYLNMTEQEVLRCTDCFELFKERYQSNK